MMDEPGATPGSPTVDLRDYIEIMRRRKWTVAIIVLLAGLAGLLYSLRQTPLYVSTAEILVDAVDLSPGQAGSVATPNMQTEHRLMRSTSVAQLAAEALGTGESILSLQRRLSVGVVADTEILQVQYQHPIPVQAQRGAAAFAQAYLDFRRQRILDELLAASRPLSDQIDVLSDRLRDLNERIAQTTDPSVLAGLQTEATALVGQIAVAQQRLSDLTTPENLRVGQVVDAADLPTSPASPTTTRNVAAGVVLGVLLGIGAAILRERLDDRLRGADDLEAYGRAPVLAVIPRFHGWRHKDHELLFYEAGGQSGTWEAYRALRAALLFATAREGTKTVLVTSPRAHDGKSTVTSNLGVALAQAGKRVILVSGDLRAPRLHRFFALGAAPGVTDVLLADVPLSAAVQQTRVANLKVVGSGVPTHHTAELLQSEQMGELIGHLRAQCDYVLIDAAPVLLAADSLALAPRVDGVLLVADAQDTSRNTIAHARQRLEQVGAKFVGAVLNNYRSKVEGYPAYAGRAEAPPDTPGESGVLEDRGSRRRTVPQPGTAGRS